MRLKNKEIEIIKDTIQNYFGKSRVYLFGSRLDDSKKGGDIDLFVISEVKENLYELKIKTKAKLKSLLNKPIDLIVHRDFSRKLEQEALQGMEL
jgi:predicted nucleotidyltransferase